jgi:hypothetical protein
MVYFAEHTKALGRGSSSCLLVQLLFGPVVLVELSWSSCRLVELSFGRVVVHSSQEGILNIQCLLPNMYLVTALS